MIAFISFTLFLVYANVPGVLVSAHGVPKAVAALIPLMLVLPVAYRVLLRGEAIRFPAFILAALAMLACHLISALHGERPFTSFETVFSWLAEGVFLAFLIVNAVRTRAEVFAAVRAVVFAGAAMGFIVLLQQLLGPAEHGMAGFGQFDSVGPNRTQYRLAGPIGEKNRFAQILAVLIPVAGGLAVAARGARWPYALAILCMTAGILLTFSRGAMVALVATVPFALMFRLLKPAHLVVSGVLLALAVATLPPLTKRVASIGDVALQSMGLAAGGFRNADSASRGRVTEMRAAWLVFLDHPLVGAGPGMAPVHYAEYAVLAGGKVRQGARRSHSLYLQLAAETGVIGLAAMFVTLWAVLYPLDASRRAAEMRDRQLWGLNCGLELALLILLATSVLLHAAFIRYFWLLLALAVCAAQLPVRVPPRRFSELVMQKMRSRPRQLEART